MIFINNLQKVDNYFETEKEFINYSIKSHEKQKNIIVKYMQNFANSTADIDFKAVESVLHFLDDLKVSLDLCNENIVCLERLLSTANEVVLSIKNNSETLENEINNFNSKYINSQKKIIENTLKIENCLYFISEKSELIFAREENIDEKPPELVSFHFSNINYDENTSSEKNIVTSETNSPKKEYVEKTLIVSETSGNVILPYEISKLNGLLENGKYSTIDEIINQEYTLPISMFKNPFIARFREAFKLMRNKEKNSIKEAFDLGTELMFNYNLHPAIISACKNLDELDIYLDYLENGETNKFDCFKVVFELPPAVVKQKNPF